MDKKKFIVIGFCVFSLMSCINKKGIDISDYPVVTMSYAELPTPVKSLLDEKIKEVVEAYDDLAYSTNREITFRYYRKETDSWLEEVNNNDDYFVVGGKTYRKKGNNGDPYIYHDGSIYYCEYNLNLENYKSKKYYKISLER